MRMIEIFKLAAFASLLAAAGFSAPAMSPEAARSARNKLDRITSEKLEKGESVILTQDEFNSFLRYDSKLDLPKGVHDLEVRLDNDRGEIRARVDLSMMQSSGGGAAGFLVQMLLSGERNVRAICRYTSEQGKALIDVELVEIDGRRISGSILGWLISSYVVPKIPEFEPGRPLPLPHNLREIRLEPGRAVLTSY